MPLSLSNYISCFHFRKELMEKTLRFDPKDRPRFREIAKVFNDNSSEIPESVTPAVKQFRDALTKFYSSDSFCQLIRSKPGLGPAVHLETIWVDIQVQTDSRDGEKCSTDYRHCLDLAKPMDIPVILKANPKVGKLTTVKKVCYDFAMETCPNMTWC